MKSKTGPVPVLLAAIIGIAAIWAGNHFGFWWITMLVGLGIGLLLRGTWGILLAAALAGVGGWGLDLLWQSRQVDIGGAASVVAGILGLGQPYNGLGPAGASEFGASNGYIVILLTLVLALLLSLVGSWAGAALRRAAFAMQGLRSGAAPSPSQQSDLASTEAAPAPLVEG